MLLVCGEALFDVFLGPDDGDPRSVAMEARAGGSPFNVAIGVARLGGAAALLTGVSTDALGARLSRALSEEGVDSRFLLRSGRRTTLSLVQLDPAGAPRYAFYGVGSADCGLTVADMPALPDAVRALHFGSYSLVVEPVASAFAHLAQRESGRLISLDPNVRPTIEPDMDVWRRRVDAMAAHAAAIKTSDEDLALLYPGDAPQEAAGRWLALGAALVVVTRGPRGATAYRRGGATSVAAPKVKVVDTVGAGDAFQAALLTRLLALGARARADIAALNEETLRATLAYAAAAGAIACGRRGADLPRAADLA